MNRKISVIGLGYVGLPVAVAFGQKSSVVAFDINVERVSELKQAIDHTGEVETAELKSADINFTTEVEDLKKADFHIVAVPTPIDEAKIPNLKPLLSASASVGKALKSGDIVVFESTVYPGATEEDAVPVLEKYSGLKCGEDFFVGYSPERINPADKEHTFTQITKVVSGQTPEVLDVVADVYGSVVEAGVFRASTIKVAEAAKVIENTQRDLNIALVNELAMIFNQMGINTHEVLQAAGSKWNFLPFAPGLVGGHCIGVDPYYLTHKAILSGYQPEVILAGRRVNDGMGPYVASQTIKQMIASGEKIAGAKVGILGITFKENCPDIRNTRVIDIIHELAEYGVDVLVCDPLADAGEVKTEYGIELATWDDMNDLLAVVLAVPHAEFVAKPVADFAGLLKQNGLVVDVKSVLDRVGLERLGVGVWGL